LVGVAWLCWPQAGRPLVSSQPVGPVPAVSRGAFDQWLATFHSAPQDQRATLNAAGIVAAKERRALMAQWIQQDPQRAIAAAIPLAARANLPAEIIAQLETPIDTTGMLAVVIACSDTDAQHAAMGVDPAAAAAGTIPHHGTWREAIIGGKTYRAHVYGRRQRMLTLNHVALHGIVLDDHFAIQEMPSRRLESGDPGYQADSIVIQTGNRTATFANATDAEKFEQSLILAESKADGPRVVYPEF
jgi:hypothetical protein